MLPLGDPTAPTKVRPRGAKIMVIVGAVLMVLGFFGATNGVDAVQKRINHIRNAGPNLRNSVLAEIKVPGSGNVELEPGEYDVFAIATYGSGFRQSTTTTSTVPRSTTTLGDRPATSTIPGTIPMSPAPTRPRSPVGIEDPDVTLTDPHGDELFVQEPGIGAVFGGPSGEMKAVAKFTVVESGTYRLEASGGNAAKVGIAPSVSDRDAASVLVSGLFTGLAFLGGGLGFLFLLIGGVWMLVGGKPKTPPPVLWAGPSGPSGPSAWSQPPPPGAWYGGAPVYGGAPGWVPPPGGGPAPGWAPPPSAGPWAPPTAPSATDDAGATGPAGPTGPLGVPPEPPAPWGNAPPSTDQPPPFDR